MKVTTGKVFELLGAIGAIFTETGVFDVDGNFANPAHPTAIATAAAKVEQLLIANGVVIDGNVDKFIQSLPFVLQLFGLK